MTRISAGNTLTNQYAPPFVVSDSVATSWQLRWNADLIAFEAFDPSENVIVAGFDTIEQALFLNTTNQQVFVVPWGVDTTVLNPKASLYITINGVKQHTNTYSISAGTNTTSITLGGTTGIGDDVEIIGLQTTGGATVELFTGAGDGADTTFDLTWLAPSEQSLLITLDGIKQDTSAYSIDNTGLTTTTVIFVTAPGASVAIEIVGITTTGETPASPVDASNLGGSGEGIFGAKRVVGETQILDFKSLIGGTSIALTATTNAITIDATVPTFANLGSGDQVIAPTPGTTAPLDLHSVSGGDRTAIALASGVLTFNHLFGYVADGTATVNAVAGDRLIAVTNTGAPVTVNLLAIAELAVGDTITIKDQSGGASTNNITVTPASENIDGVGTHVINTNFGYVTLYSDGFNYFIIAQG